MDFSEPQNKTSACNNNGLILLKWWKYGSGFPEGARRRLSCCKGYHLTATTNLNKARTPPGSLCTALVVYRNYKPVLSRQGSISGLCSMARQWEVYWCAALLWLVKWLLSGRILWRLEYWVCNWDHLPAPWLVELCLVHLQWMPMPFSWLCDLMCYQ